MSNRLLSPRLARLGALAVPVAAALMLSACGGAAPVPTSTPAPKPAAPTAASAPTSAPTVAAGALTGDATRGATVFNNKCASCHSIGSGKVVGPDLKGVTQRRDRAWLMKWIKDPAAVVNSGDAIAKQLVQEYGRTMPNPGLDDQQVADVIVYIQSRS